MRRCSNCGEQTKLGAVTDTYTREGVELEITVSGIPAEVCPVCGWNCTDIETTKEIGRLVSPLFESASQLSKLPVPKVAIEFPSLVTA